MDSSVVLSDMTPGEKSFALWLEHLLNKIAAAEYRQLNIESLRVLASFFRQNPTLQIDDACVLDAMIGHAVRLAYLDQHADREAGYNDSQGRRLGGLLCQCAGAHEHLPCRRTAQPAQVPGH